MPRCNCVAWDNTRAVKQPQRFKNIYIIIMTDTAAHNNKGRGHAGRGGRGAKNYAGRGHDRGGRGSPRSVIITSELDSNAAVPQLGYGHKGNWDPFKRKMIVVCLEKYKNLGRLIQDEAYYDPPAVDVTAYNLTVDPYQIERSRMTKAYEARDKEIREMKKDRTGMYAYIMSKISKESLDEISRDKDFKQLEVDRDPLSLWLMLKKTHMVSTVSKVETIIKESA